MRADRMHTSSRSRVARLAANALVALALLAPLAPAQQEAELDAPLAPVTFAVTSPWPAIVNHGWWPVYADITNNTRGAIEGRIVARSWTHGVDVDVPIALGPLETARIELELPAFHVHRSPSTDSNYSLQLTVRGHDDARMSESIQRDGLQGVRAVAIATPRHIEGGIETAWGEAIKLRDVGESGSRVMRLTTATVIGGGPGTPGASPKPTATGRPDVELAQVLYDELPMRVAAYTSLDLLIVPSVDRLPSVEQRSALLAWVRSGGRLALLGADTLRTARADPELAAWLEPRFRVSGDSDAAAVHACGLGWIGLAEAVDPTEPEAAALIAQLLNDFPITVASATPSASVSIVPSRTDKWSPAIPGLDHVPMRAFIVVLFVFWLLIGPINFYLVASRWKKPALLLVTIPVLALVFSLLLFGYGIADQGLTTRQAVKSLSLLDQRDHRANSVDLRQLFIGFSAGDGLQPGPNTVVYPAVHATDLDDERYVVHAGAEPALTGAFCPERTPQLLQVQSERSSRLRCDLVESGGGARFRNGLDASIRELVVRGFDGRAWRANAPIEVGAEAILEPLDDPGAAFSEFAGRHKLDNLSLLRGSYLATIESNSLLDDCALGAEEVEGLHALIGILEPAAGAAGESR